MQLRKTHPLHRMHTVAYLVPCLPASLAQGLYRVADGLPFFRSAPGAAGHRATGRVVFYIYSEGYRYICPTYTISD